MRFKTNILELRNFDLSYAPYLAHYGRPWSVNDGNLGHRDCASS